MDAGASKLLESVTLKTLHAHNFARSSTQASMVLTDLLSRYLTLLSTTCAQYAQHAGRTNLTVRDAFSAFDELGVSLEELREYCEVEGSELARYAGHSTKRVEDLNDFKGQLGRATCAAYVDDAIPLVYAPVPDDVSDEEDEEEEEEEDEDIEMVERREKVDVEMAEAHGNGHPASSSFQAGILTPPDTTEARPPSPWRRPSTPPLPLSPVSNPSSPARKRQRTERWHPPSHIPDFLPPFPTERGSLEPEPLALPPIADPSSSNHNNAVKIEREPSPIRHFSTAPADYTSAVPYNESTLGGIPEWHLPPSESFSSHPHTAAPAPRLPVPQMQPSLLAAYHHILTHPPPPQPPAPNLSRHRVAMAFLNQTQRNPRWEPADSLFASTAPNAPAVATMGPSYAVPIDPKDKAEEKHKKLPSVPARTITPVNHIMPLVSQQTSRIPELARQVLPGTVIARTTRLAHPPVLKRGPEDLTYGTGISAPWNSTATPTGAAAPTTAGGKNKDPPVNGMVNGKGKDKEKESAEMEKRALPDAKMYATWEYDQKSFRDPPMVPRRARQGSYHTSIHFPGGGGGRARSESRIG
ncbi:hypothetical protein OF83DRAFT_1064528 [Amylostereum chailletii]|nr:hypothetical protein OF83DRAFT_1064528 [Amylostereum chailletii]